VCRARRGLKQETGPAVSTAGPVFSYRDYFVAALVAAGFFIVISP
jgi:hypothetical protein